LPISLLGGITMLWSNLLDVIRGSLFVLAHWCGGSIGTAILVGSAAVRVALLPLTLRAARRRVRQERVVAALAPQLAQIKQRYASEPTRLVAETQKLHAAHGISTIDRQTLIDALVQMPAVMSLYSAIRGVGAKAGGFLWIADVTKPDRWLAALAATVAAAVAWLSLASPEGKTAAQAIPVLITGIITLLVLSHLSAGLALYSIANSVVGGVERRIALRTRGRIES
jgi:YidC/Oxa1 family membrane protein insertase